MGRFDRAASMLIAPIRARPITAATLFLSVVALAAIAYFLTAFLKVEERTATISFFAPDALATVTTGQLTIHKGVSVDEVFVSLGLLAGDSDKEAVFGVAVPESFAPAKEKWHLAGLTLAETATRDHVTRYFFRLKPGSHASLMLSFKGYLLATVAREVDLSLLVDASDRQQLPISFMITGLDRSDMINLDPVPAEKDRSAYALVWPRLPTASTSGYTLRLHLRDRAGGYRTDIILILAGILAGVFASFLASIGWDLAKEAEARLRSQRNDA